MTNSYLTHAVSSDSDIVASIQSLNSKTMLCGWRVRKSLGFGQILQISAILEIMTLR